MPSILGEKSDFLGSEEPKLGTEEAARSPEGSHHHDTRQRHAMDTIMEEAERSEESKEERARQSRQSFSFTSFGPFSGDICCLGLSQTCQRWLTIVFPVASLQSCVVVDRRHRQQSAERGPLIPESEDGRSRRGEGKICRIPGYSMNL